MSPQTIIFIGRSGSGKGTQAKLVEEYLKKIDTENRAIYYLETGAGFREFIVGQNYTNKLSNEAHLRNERQPDFLAVWMWTNLLIKETNGQEHLIIDGAPRSLLEATVLNNALEFYGRRANVVHIKVDREEAIRRLLERGQIKNGRADDSSMTKITKRLDWFDNDVVPGIEYLKKQTAHNFIEVDGTKSVDEVHADIVSALKIV